MDASALRPLGIGETLDVAIKLYQSRFATLAKAVAVVVTPVYVFTALVQFSLPNDEEFADSTVDPTTGDFDFGEFWTFFAGLAITVLAGYLASQLATAASFKIVSGTYLGEEPDWRTSLGFAFSRLRSLIWLSIVFYVLLVLAFFAFVIPLIYFYAAWTVAVPVLLLEDIRGRKALKRSRKLVRGRWWQVAVVILLANILTSLVGGALSGVLIGVSGAAGSDVVDAVAEVLGSTLGAIITTPFAATVIMVVYFDLRVRKEGFDLELLAHQVGIEPGGADRSIPPPPPPPPAPGPGEPPFWPPPPGWRPSDE